MDIYIDVYVFLQKKLHDGNLENNNNSVCPVNIIRDPRVYWK